MCNPDRIAAILIGASVAILIAVGCYLAVLALGSNWYTSGSNPWLMIAAGVSIGIAIGVVGAALSEATKCQRPPCKTFGDRLVAALGTMITTLTIMLAAGIVLAFPSAFPWAGSAIGAVMAAMAVAAGIALMYISLSVVPTLMGCLGGASTAVTVLIVVGGFAGFLLAGLGLVTLTGRAALPFPLPVG